MTRAIHGAVSRHFDDLDSVLEFDALDDFRQLIFVLQSSPCFRNGVEKFEHYKLGRLRRQGSLRGDVTVVTKNQNASGDLAIYDMKTKTITRTGNVVVSQGKNVLHGERVVAREARVASGVAARDRVESGVTTHGCG